MTRRRLIAIVNDAAGANGTSPVAGQLTDIFTAAGIDARVVLARDGAEIAARARAAVRERPQIVVAGGGDGTINAVAAELLGSDIMLGVLPLGTLNHFAKALRLPTDVDAAARVIVDGHALSIDVGEVNGRIFLNNSSLGLYPRLVRRRENQQQQLGRNKWLAAVWAAATLLRRHRFLHVRLCVDDAEIDRRTAIVFVGNNAYRMSGLSIGERERLDAGELSVYLPRRSGRRGLVLLALRALVGRLREAEDFDALFSPAFEIQTRRARVPVAIDGEVALFDAPLRYRIRPGALRVIAPRANGAG